MKTRQIVSSLALAAAVALGATGCGLVAPQGTLEPYAPSDGIDVNLEGVDVRNLMLIADQSGDNFNVVFAGVNKGDAPVLLRLTFVDESGSSKASADFLLEPGLTSFGNPEGDIAPTLVSIAGLKAGATVMTYIEAAGGGEQQRAVPVLDGTLAEYQDYVLSPAQLAVEDDEADAENDATGDASGSAAAAAGDAQGDEEAAQ